MLLIDTNALLWLSSGSDRLGAKARMEIDIAANAGSAAFSAISIWEAGLLARKGRYAFGQSVLQWRADLIAAGLMEAPLDGVTAALAETFDEAPPDPADRLIAASAARLDATLLTSDRWLLSWALRHGRFKALDATV